MSEPHQMYVLAPGGVPAEQAVRAVHRAIADAGGELHEESLMLLNDVGADDDREFEEVGDPEEALARVIAWPTLGGLTYDLPDGAVLVSFEGGDGLVRCVILETPETIGDLDPEAIERYRRLGSRLHEELSAVRTVMGWGLSAQGREWRTELARAADGDRSGSFELLDLQR